jgi:xanthine dehydrogenase YagT iron-sulfur-binding subunit
MTLEQEPTMTNSTGLEVRLRVNGVEHVLTIDPRVSLLDALREHLHLTGTKKGCDQGACGACTVLVDGERINSCLALAVQYDGCEVTTIEGLAERGRLSALQSAFIEHDGFQCGYCTSGQICSAVAMVSEFRCGLPSAVTRASTSAALSFSDDEIKERMSGNLCRCGAYNGIVDAIHATFDAEVAA